MAKQDAENRYRLFLAEYLKDFNASRAYLECGCYKTQSIKTAYASACKLLKRPRVQELKAEMQHDRAKRLEIEGDNVVAEQGRIAFADIRDVMSWDAFELPGTEIKVKASKDLTDDEAAAIAGFDFRMNTHGFSFRLRYHPKGPALDALFRHLGLYAADRKIDITTDKELETVRDRLSKLLGETGSRLKEAHSNGHHSN